jgi:uncharacterized protein (DUF2384 family)
MPLSLWQRRKASRSAAQRGETSEAARFVPVNEQAAKIAGENKQLTRAEYEALDHAARHQFFKDGGTLVDEIVE